MVTTTRNVIAVMAACLALLCGCRKSANESEAPALPAGVIRITPTKLLTGELNRLEAHLGLTTTGCLRIEAPDDDIFVGFEAEVWEGGKRLKWLGSSSSPVRVPTETSFSFCERQDASGKKKFTLVTAVIAESGAWSWTLTGLAFPPIPKEAHSSHYRLSELAGSLELSPGELVPVWAYVINEKRPEMGMGTPEEAAKASRWALVIKLKWEPPPGKQRR